MKITDWKLALKHHKDVYQSNFDPKTADEILNSDADIIPASVPGNFELDLIKAGKLPKDIYFGTNILKLQQLEDAHLWYFTQFTLTDSETDKFLLFEGIDTASEIYIDGVLFANTENMLIPYEFSLDGFKNGTHELVVHIIPANVYASNYPLDSKNYAQKYSYDSLAIRKAPYMYGWDIMPRAVSGGLWRPVSVVNKPKLRIENYSYSLRKLDKAFATVTFKGFVKTDAENIRNFTIRIEGECGDSAFSLEQDLFTSNFSFDIKIDSPCLWWPKNYGDPNLYKTKITLLFNGKECDSAAFNMGIRRIELERTSCAGEDGTFCFKVNNKKIFIMGTNWVPTDVFPSRHREYNRRALDMVNDLNCNMIRCWGGNVYPEKEVYDYCDKNGILVWQDFSMACGIYPNDERFCKLIETETEWVVKSLINHPSVALWSGDNECDIACSWCSSKSANRIDPNKNIVTRRVIPDVISRLDTTRPYIPSSPYIDETVFRLGSPAEDHLWGPRDYFKGDFYNKNSVCHFASETGYHGCPSPESLGKFMSQQSIVERGDADMCNNIEWLTHATCPEPYADMPFAYRIPLMTRQIERIFGAAADDIETYSLQSQISQAEADKFFIEHFRIGKWYRTGIVWWNLIDGWPQVSDAVVDWYGDKKLAYDYIKRSQMPFCIMCDEPDENGVLKLCASNDTREYVSVSYTVKDVIDGQIKAKGKCTVPADSTIVIDKIPEIKGEYLIIEWSGDKKGINHFVSAIGEGITLSGYNKLLTKLKETSN